MAGPGCKEKEKAEETPSECGNGILEENEQCDDGADNSDTLADACRKLCMKAFCGDSVIDSGEECDNGPSNSNDTGSTCSLNCTKATCGNGIRELTEECDDGNTEDNDGCLNSCEKAICGDGVVCTEAISCALLGAGVEQCDDGNTEDADECSNSCALLNCGDGILNPEHEECDDGNTENKDYCLNTCKHNLCGDGIVNAEVEACDDANAQTEACGDDETSCTVCDHLCQQRTITPVTNIAAGTDHTCAVFAGGEVKCWGGNEFGQLGYNDMINRGNEPDQALSTILAVDLGNDVKVTQLALGRYFSCALLSDQKVKCWGKNYSGQLGQNTMEIIGDGCSGDDLNERVCTTERDEMGDSLPAIDLGTDVLAQKVSAGDTHVCALTTAGEVKCWGSNLFGQLGRNDIENMGDGCSGDELNRTCESGAAEMGNTLVAVDLGTTSSVIDISSGYAHSCALFADGTVRCWGHNSMGQLGRGDEEIIGDGCVGDSTSTRTCETSTDELGAQLSPVALSASNTQKALMIASGSRFNCAWLDNQKLKCWGENNFAQLGSGDTETRGDEADEMGESLSGVNINNAIVREIALGKQHSCALLHSGDVKCWGNFSYGRLGVMSESLVGDAADEMGVPLQESPIGSGALPLQLALGESHNCALLSSGEMKCWGRNTDGQLGLSDDNHRGDDNGEMGDLLPVLSFEATE